MSDESEGSADGDDEFTWGVSAPDDQDATDRGSVAADASGDEDGSDADRRVRDDGSTVHGDEADRRDDEAEYEPSLAGVVGANREEEQVRRDLVPESPSLENALFLLVGVLLGGYVIYDAATTFGV